MKTKYKQMDRNEFNLTYEKLIKFKEQQKNQPKRTKRGIKICSN